MAEKQTPASFDDWASAGGGIAPVKTGFGARIGDVGLSIAKGVVAVPEAAVGLADLATGGKAGKAAEKLGFRPKEAKEFLESKKSDAAKDAAWRFENADGFTGKLGAAAENPSLIVNALAESAPLMGAGGVVGRGVSAMLPRAAGAAGAIGEGVVGAGSAAEQIRQQTPDGELTGTQTALAAGTGVATGLLGMGGKYVAGKLGVGDIDQAIATGSTKVAGPVGKDAPGMLKRVGGGALAEGVLEELPQSVAEQGLQNLALDKSFTEDLDAAAAMGLVTGGAMGAGMGIMSSPAEAKGAAPGAQAPTLAPPAQPPVAPAVGPSFGMVKPVLDERALYAAGVNPPATLDAARLDGMLADTVATIFDADGVFAKFDFTGNEEAREGMRSEMDSLATTYGGKVTSENLYIVDGELAQQFDWYKAATPGARMKALQHLAKLPLQPDSDADLIAQEQAGGVRRTYDPRAGVPPESPLGLVPNVDGVPFEEPAKPFGQNFVMPERPSVAMGLDPALGGMTAAAALAVDSGASPAVTQGFGMRRMGEPVDVQPITGAAGQIGTPRRLGETPIIDVEAREVKDQQAIAGQAPRVGMTPRIGFDSPTPGALNGPQADQAQQAEAQRQETPAAGVAQDRRSANLAILKTRMLAGRNQNAQAGTSQPAIEQSAAPAEPLGPTAIAVGGNASTVQTMPQPAQQQQAQSLKPLAQAPAALGRNGVPMAEGGELFQTKAEADTARKLQPMMRVKRDGKGFVLVEKTPAQIAAQEKAARRNLGSVGAGGGPLPAHAFLASQGGLSKSTMADLGFDRNVRVGSKWLFTNTGMTLEGMTEALQQNGYMQGTEQNPAIEMVRRSASGQPQYTADGWDQIAQAEATARFEDHLAAQQDAMAEDEDFDPFSPSAIAGEFEGDDLVVAGYDAAKDPIKQEVAALLDQLDAMGIDSEVLREDVARETADLSEQDYYERLKDRATRAINEAAGGGGSGPTRQDAGEGRGQEAQPRSGGDRRQDDGREGTPGTDGEAISQYGAQNAGFESAEVARIFEAQKQGITKRIGALVAANAEKRKVAMRSGRRHNTNAAKMIETVAGAFGIPATNRVLDKAIGMALLGDDAMVALAVIEAAIGKAKTETKRLAAQKTATPAEGLTAPTRADIEAQQARAQQAERKADADKRQRDEEERVRRERADIAKASVAAADTFELGQDPLQSLTGQQDIFGAAADSAAAPAAPVAPAAPTPSDKPDTRAITTADVTQATADARAVITSAIDAMPVQQAQKIAAGFFPSMGMPRVLGKKAIKATITDKPLNLLAAASEFGAELSSETKAALQAEFEGRVEAGEVAAKPEPKKAEAAKPASQTPAMDAHAALMDAVRSGKATPEQFKAGFEAVVAGVDAIKAELGTHTKADLLKMGGPYMRMRYASENKPEIIDALYREMLDEFTLGESFSYGMAKDSYRNAIRRMVDATDADKLAKYVAERKAAIEEAAARRVAAAQAVADPKTLDDFKAAVRAAMLEGKTRKEAYLTLTPEQRIRFDELDAESTREARETRKRAQKTQVQAAGQTTGGQIIATKHTRDGYDLFVVQLSDRLSKEDYSTVLASAKRMGGWYSAFRGNGATPGFQFKEKASAEAFLKLAGGDTTAAQDQAVQRRDAFEDDRSQTAAERLTEMADRLEAQADEELGRDRKANTARRARFAASAKAAASNVKALAKTMRNIATAIGDGKAKFLDAVRQKTQVEMLAGVVHTAKHNELVARFPEYADREKRKGEPPTIGTADFAEFPTFTAFRSDLASLARQMLEVDGTKKLGQQLMGVADDVTDAYLDFAKGNLLAVSQFGRGGAMADFSSKATAEAAIRRSGLVGKAIVLPIKRGENRVILSPSEAMNRGVWKGDGDKRITLTKDAGMELVQAIGRKGNQSNGLKVPWQFETAADRLKALSRMGIETPSEFRSAVREFISLRVQAQEADRVKAMERAMVGRKADGLDFFPTPAEVADQMVEAAGIEPDMAVLEPSAGMGHLADRIRAAGVEPDVVELSGDRRELLEEKGFTVVGTDFMQMKPRTFFTYGDVFSAPDGKEGVMRGQGGMGSDRVRLVDDTGNILGYYNRDELTGVRHSGTESGYDRIIMNPPFGDRRDAEHVRHAYSLLKPGGRLVAIMGEGVFFGKDKKAEDFREWLDTLGGTSEKLPEGSFMDPSLPVTTGVNARMVVVEKPAGAAVFSQNLLSQKLGPKPTLDQIERFVQRVQDVAKNVIPVTVVGNPAQINVLDVPAGSSPSGALIDGRIYLFADNIKSVGDAYSTLFHEIFHLGLQKVIPAEAYSSLLKQFAASPLVARYVRQWKQSPEGVEKAGTMPAQAYEALATEEALAMVSETLAADQNIGSAKLPGLVKRMLAWFAQVADQLGFPANFGNWMRGLTQTAAERFVSDMTRAVLGGDKNLAKTQAKYGTQAAELSSQNRLRAGDEADGGVRFRQSSEALNGTDAFSVKGATADQLAHYRGMGMQVLGRRQIVDLYGDMLPELKQYDTLVQRMDADKNESGAEADALVSDWAKLDERAGWGVGLAKHPGMERKLAELMHDATLAQIDPAKPLQRGDDPGAHKALAAKFEALSPKAQEVYRTARDMYANHFKKVQAAIQARIQRSGMDETSKAKMIAKMDADLFNKLKGVYFPLARFGKYVVVSKNAAGETVSVSRAETLAEANKMRREVVKNSPPGVTVSRVYKDAEFNATRDAVGKGFVSDLMTMLQGQGVGEDVLDSVGQLYLSSLPDLSWAKHGIHRKGTPGFSQDARRAFAQNMFHGARHLAKLRYSDQLADKLMDMEERVKDRRDDEGFDPIKAQQVVDEMNARHETLMSPKASSLSTALTSVGFVWFLGISPASALVNLSQTALVAYPVMAAKWGFQKAGTALLSASGEVVRAGNDLSKVLKDDELAAFQKAVDDGTIDVTQAHDLAGVAQGEDERVAMAMRPVMRAASFMFHHAEKFNRQATFIAAYRLAKESGADADLAFEQAKKATYDGHFDYSASNRPRLMQGNWQKVLFLFKQYGQNMVYTLTRQAYLSMKGMTPQQRTEARKQLGGLLAMHAMAAGALGLPLVGVLLSAASMLGSDDDEPWDAEVAMKNTMADAMGPKAAEVMAHGLSRLTPWDLSGRVALNKLILPDIQEGLEGQPLWEKMVTAAAGPVAGIGQGIFKGMAEMGQGQYQRGLESMLPVALKNPVKAMRFGEEGVADKTGVVIKDEVGMAGLLGQASGFRPSEVALATEGKSAIYQADKALTERRSNLVRHYAMARMSDDAEGVQDALEQVRQFNEKNPNRRITIPQLMQSVRNRQRRIDDAEQGVYLPKNRRDAVEAGRFAVVD